jgi:hypothetical protein
MTPYYEDPANKFLPYDVLTNIPAQILQARNSERIEPVMVPLIEE